MISPYKISVKAHSVRETESQLERAVQDGITEALKRRTRGVLVTRHDYTTFTVELSHDVPFGITLERDKLQRRMA